jgi:hypothetical protein
MRITHLPDNGTNFIPYEISGNNIDFNDGDLMFNVSKKERDYEVVIDICQDYTGSLTYGAGEGQRYVAQLVVPARSYTETEIENPGYDPDAIESGTQSQTITVREPVPFSMNTCELRLWELEE